MLEPLDPVPPEALPPTPPSSSSAASWLLRVPPAAGGHHPRRPRRARRHRPPAHGRRQEPLLPAPRRRAPRPHGRRLAAHRADEGPGRRPRRGGRAGHLPQLHPRARRGRSPRPRPPRGALPPALRRARAAHDAGLPRRPAGRRGERGRRRRGPLHQRVGARLPPGVPPDRGPPRPPPRRPPEGALRDRHRARPGRHRDLPPHARPEVLRRRLRPAEPALPGRGQGRRHGPARRAPRPQEGRVRHRLRAEPQGRRAPRRAPPRGRHRRRRLPRGDGRRRSLAHPGGVHPRRGARHLRDRRLRHGHRQAQRPLRRPPRPPEGPRELLPGDGARGPRRPAERVLAPLQRPATR